MTSVEENRKPQRRQLPSVPGRKSVPVVTVSAPNFPTGSLKRETSSASSLSPLLDSTRLWRRSESSASLEGSTSGEDSSVIVAVRVRPFSQRETIDENTCCIDMRGQQETLITSSSGQKHEFVYDYSFWSVDDVNHHCVDQEEVYTQLGCPLLDRSFEGYNTCLFAYGQTGSGKSYTIMGEGEAVGVIPRFSEELFYRIDALANEETTFKVEISFYEIYNEKIHDLLSSSSKKKKKTTLRVREHPVLGPYVEDLNQYVVTSNEGIQRWIEVGTRVRATAATGMNDKSSRSHSVFTIRLTQTQIFEGQECTRVSKINLIDLAGSERSSKARTSGERLREGASINRSLHTLGKVISLLSERSTGKKRKVFIPYRDSSLTWLLKESLGGNSKTAMIATISPSLEHYEESLSTLRYAQQARNIVNVAKINEDASARLIRELRDEIERLKRLLGNANQSGEEGGVVSIAELLALKEKLHSNEQLMVDHTRTWQERLDMSERRYREEADQFKRSGVAFKIENRLPTLVNLNEDPQLSEMLLYVVKEGTTTVGREDAEIEHDIELTGALVAANHCMIENNNGTEITLTPIGDAKTFVNGEQVEIKTALHHGDRVVFGGDHFFRLNNPAEVKDLSRQSSSSASLSKIRQKGFEYAKEELFQIQNERLEAEIEEAKMKANEEALAEIQRAKEEAQKLLENQKLQHETKLRALSEQMESHHGEMSELEANLKNDKNKIEELEITKQALEDELIAKKHQIYLHKLSTEKAEVERRERQTKLLTDLESEKQKIEEDVAKLKINKLQRERNKGLPGSFALHSPAEKTSKKDLMRVSLLIREANSISANLQKHTTFEREDARGSGGETVIRIRLHNTKLGITATWDLDKFESRLERMREIYEDETDSQTDDLFYDPNDEWEKDSSFSASSPSPSSRASTRSLANRKALSAPRLKELPSSLPKSFRDLLTSQAAVVASSPLLAGRRPSSQSTPMSTGGVSSMDDLTFTSTPFTPRSEMRNFGDDVFKSLTSVPVICKNMITTAMAELDDLGSSTGQKTLADRVLEQCQRLKVAATALQQIFKTRNESAFSTVPLCEQEEARFQSIHMSSAMGILTELVAHWTHLGLDSNSEVSLAESLKRQLREATQKVNVNLARMLQGLINEIDSMVDDSAIQVVEAITSVAMETGALAIATLGKFSSGRRGDESQAKAKDDKVDDDLKLAFRQGGEIFVERRLQAARSTVEKASELCQKLVERNAKDQVPKDVLDSVVSLLENVSFVVKNAKEFQREYVNCREDGDGGGGTGSSYKNYQRIKGVTGEVSDIADAVQSMSKACAHCHIERVQVATRAVAKYAVQLLDVLKLKGPHYASDASSDSSESSSLDLEGCIRSVIRAAKAVSQRTKHYTSNASEVEAKRRLLGGATNPRRPSGEKGVFLLRESDT
ncbi:kinesin-like protein KIF14 [Oscarella lobularis]|uniref:kinesin-like protein KIF14 n=1 Tax=Oscarella lobularis TaxID=121494 RepID=UPI0033138822